MKPIIEELEESNEFLLEADPPEEPKRDPRPTDRPPTPETPTNPGSDEDLFGGDTEPDFSLTDIGRIYTLRKIYSSINSLLLYCNQIIRLRYSDNIEKIRQQILQSRDLFTLMAGNIDKYTEKLDSIIDEYRKFIKKVSKILFEYAKKHNLLEDL